MITNNRSDVIPIINSNGILERDLITNNWDSFITKRAISYYEITESDIGRPDLIAVNTTTDQNLWWIIFKFNGIINPYSELVVGDIIKIPSILDIEDWLGKF